MKLGVETSLARNTIVLQIFLVQNFHAIAENHMKVNFHHKNFVIARFLCDYHSAHADNSCCRSANIYYIYVALATSSMWLLADSIQEERSCLDKGPCGFGRQLFLIF